jgi:hypothetical protein
MLAWFDATGAIEYAREIVAALEATMPLERASGKRVSRAKQAERIDRLLSRIGRAGRARKFNLYQKARFGNALTWDLVEKGYSRDFIDELVRIALTRL